MSIPSIDNALMNSAAVMGWVVDQSFTGAKDEEARVAAQNKLFTDALNAIMALPYLKLGQPIAQWALDQGGSFPVARTRSVAPVCRYGPDMTGPEYYDVWNGEDGTARSSGTLDAYAFEGLLYPDFEAYQAELTGRWYGPECRSDAPVDYKLGYWADHPAVYWLPADPVPSSRADVDPRQLAQIAYEFTELPTGTIEWNPKAGGVDATVVNLDTWVWVAGAPVTVSVRASIPSGTWAQVEAVLDHVELSAPGADPVTCDEPGIPWTAGATSTPCAIWFTHSSANQPVKAGQSLPTSTLTVTAVWTASWVSSDNPTPTALPTQEITTTAEVPVA